ELPREVVDAEVGGRRHLLQGRAAIEVFLDVRDHGAELPRRDTPSDRTAGARGPEALRIRWTARTVASDSGAMEDGGVRGGGMDRMRDMMSMMREKLAHAGDRVASLKTELKITEAQMPAWNKFAAALLAAAKSMDESMAAMHKKLMESGAAPSLPDKLQHHA